MKIPSSNMCIAIQCRNETFPIKAVKSEAEESNQIRDKLRKKKQIAKQTLKPAAKGVLNGKQKKKQLNCVKKSVQTGNSSKPIRRVDFEEAEEKENQTDGHEAVQDFFQNQLSKYYPQGSISAKQGHNLSKKIRWNDGERLIESYLHELSGQNEIKVTGLLQEKEKMLFKNSKTSQMSRYEQDATAFLMSVRKKQQKQNYEFYNFNNRANKLQKKVSLILQAGQIYQNNAFYFAGNYQQATLENLQKISLLQKQYLTEAKAFANVWAKDLAPKIVEPQSLKNIAKMLLILTKSYKSNHKKVKQILKSYQAEQEKYIADQIKQKATHLSQPSLHNDFYVKCMIKKCLIKTFSEQETLFSSDHQLWNHFKLTSYLEQNIIQQGYRDNENFISIQTEDEYREYMKRIKNKKIIYKPSLYTNCKACFSSHFERTNPIVKCPQCKSRLHKFCGKIDDRCDKCSYKKLGANLKAETPKCFICRNESTSFMLHKLKGTKFVHTFCMLVHNLWNVTNQRLTFMGGKNQQTENEDSTKSLELINSVQSVNSLSASQRKSVKSTSIVIFQEKEENSQSKSMVDESEETMNVQKMYEGKESKCKYCSKCSQKEYLKECKNCQQKFHVICAYINGCSIQISEWKNTFDVSLEIKCCSAKGGDSVEFQDFIARRQMGRKYRLNYERYALNYGFQNESKTSKLLESCCNIAQAEEQQEGQVQDQTLKCEKDKKCSEMKEESQEES